MLKDMCPPIVKKAFHEANVTYASRKVHPLYGNFGSVGTSFLNHLNARCVKLLSVVTLRK